jgi:DNA-binding NtrC family response regulator
MTRVLIVDDEPCICHTLSTFLKGAGYEVETADSAESADALLGSSDFDVVVSGLKLSHWSSVKRKAPATQVILMTGEPTGETAAQAGVQEFLEKPVNKAEILRAVGAAVERRRLDMKRTGEERTQE